MKVVLKEKVGLYKAKYLIASAMQNCDIFRPNIATGIFLYYGVYGAQKGQLGDKY